ncbi:MAG: ABC transporter permease, partial [Flavobacteriales bacterium]|nr:ABC transporter permease [Flavobacteriales bacterium]
SYNRLINPSSYPKSFTFDGLKSMEKRIYTSASNIQKPLVMVREMIADIGRGQDLAKRLTIRDIKAMYRQSFLGIIWAFIIPIANTVTWVFLNSTGLVSMGDTGIPYPIYVFSGTMIWAIFLESMQAPITIMTANKTMIAKVNFPREALVMSAIYQSLFNSGIKAIILMVALGALGYFAGFGLLLFPLALIALVIAGTAVGVMLTPIGALYTDISKGIPLVMQFLMYTTPVIYAIPKEGLAAKLVLNNPLTPLIMTARDWLTGQPAEFLNGFLWVTLGAAVLLMVVMVFFRLAIPILVERMNA